MQNTEPILHPVETEFRQHKDSRGRDTQRDQKQQTTAPQRTAGKVGANAADADKRRREQKLQRFKKAVQRAAERKPAETAEQIERVVKHHAQDAEAAYLVEQRDPPFRYGCHKPTFFCTLRSVLPDKYSAAFLPSSAQSRI